MKWKWNYYDQTPSNIYCFKLRSFLPQCFNEPLKTHAVRLCIVITVSRLSQSVKPKLRGCKTISYLLHKVAKTFLKIELVLKEMDTHEKDEYLRC